MKKFLKENWFVAVIACIFIVMTIVVTVDQHKDDITGKTVDGQDVIFSIDDTDYTADELYESLYYDYGKAMLTEKIMDAILDEFVETTDEIEEEADYYVSYYTSYYYYYGGITYLNELAVSYGYDTFYDYMLYSIKSRELSTEYISERIDEYVTDEFIETYQPRMVSYVLISFEDADESTADEIERYEAAVAAWESDEYSADNFDEFAIAYSEDSSTASSGGVFGYLDTESSVVEEFLEAALALEEGEVSDWIYSEDYGYFLIKCDSVQPEDYMYEAGFVSTVLSEYEDLSTEIIAYYYQQSSVEFADEDVKEYFEEQLGLTSSDDDTADDDTAEDDTTEDDTTDDTDSTDSTDSTETEDESTESEGEE